MNEPERIIDGPQSLATSLLTVARSEAPPAQATARALAAIGLSVTASTVVAASAKTAAAASALKPATPGLFAIATKWTIVGVSGVALTVGAAHGYRAYSSHNARPKSASFGLQPAPGIAPHDEPPLTAAPVATPLPTSVATPARVLGRRAQKPVKVSEAGNAPVMHSLSEEVAAIDKVRAAAQAHDARSMLRLLNDYQRDFPNGALGTEAQVLLVEALVRSGQTAAAMPLGRQLLKAAPSGPHAVRIRALLPDLEEIE